eukprot:CAMPEP_0185758676 /NCGR_PEP_ID=MMETSP1174-20130828/17359_1 /TAXON_ID=35687 /ORGANISM="Dictyocha speculum, Strain CCMP1381" /LENGTH=52 /DNA_ID=CAMNT_0028438647 /DNA_START=112 /DNA_END=270 /DNA_ORIENTATION=-
MSKLITSNSRSLAPKPLLRDIGGDHLDDVDEHLQRNVVCAWPARQLDWHLVI